MNFQYALVPPLQSFQVYSEFHDHPHKLLSYLTQCSSLCQHIDYTLKSFHPMYHDGHKVLGFSLVELNAHKLHY